MSPLSVSLDPADPPVGVVALHGEHDAYSAHRLANELTVLLDSGARVVIDLSDATFIDSQTLSALLAARHEAEAHELAFVLALPEEPYTQVHRILELTGLGSAFAQARALPAALALARAGVSAPHQAPVA